MKYSVQSSVPTGQVSKPRVTWEAAYEMLEANIANNRTSSEQSAHDLEACEVIHNLTVAQIMKSNGSLEQLGESALNDMSSAFGVSVESIKSMDVEDFIAMTNKNMPGRGTEPASEDMGIAIFTMAVIAFYVLAIGGAILAASKMTKYEFWWNEKLEPSVADILKQKGEKALSEVMLSIFDAKEYAQQIKACHEILDFLEQDVKKLYGDSVKIVDIEKQANKLWVCPQALVMTSDAVIIRDINRVYTVLNEWFDSWVGNRPEATNKTLGEHGFTYKTLISTQQELTELCDELVKIGRLHATIQDGHIKARKEITPGFWKSIKLFFTEKREDREKRKQAELILNAKYAALRNLCRGFDYSVREMCGHFFAIAVKTEKYVKAEAKSA